MKYRSFKELLEYNAEKYPEYSAFIYGSEKNSLTNREFKERVYKRSEELDKEAFSVLGILCDGSIDCVIEIFACVLTKKQLVLFNQNIPDEILKELIDYTDVDRLYGDEELVEEFEDKLSHGITERNGNILFFTSGTTQRSKAVVLNERSLLASAYNGSDALPLTKDDILLNMLPLDHVFGFVCGLLWGITNQATVALGRGLRHSVEDCLFFRPTALSAVPMLWGFLLKQKAINPELKLVLIGAGDCSDELLQAGKAMGIRISFGYGMTETSSGVAISVEGDPRAMQVCKEDEITIAEDGEILVRADTCMMSGYYKMRQETEEVLKDGILYTGDLGYLDEEGKLHITGRKKEMIIMDDGTKVFLPEYEKELMTVLNNTELCVVKRENSLRLVIQSDEDEESIIAKIKAINDMRPRSQQINKIEKRKEALPRTASGKVKRWEI